MQKFDRRLQQGYFKSLKKAVFLMPGANTLTMRNGCRFWGLQIDPDFYTIRPRETDELFPWDFIDAGVTKEFLIREVGNGTIRGRHPEKLQRTLFRLWVQENMNEVCAMKIRIKFRKYGALKFVGHLDMMRYFSKGTKTMPASTWSIPKALTLIWSCPLLHRCRDHQWRRIFLTWGTFYEINGRILKGLKRSHGRRRGSDLLRCITGYREKNPCL